MDIDATPTEVVRLLIALKGIYTFRELEAYLKVPLQVLWRYTKHLSVPEKNTARKILREIEENNLILNNMSKLIRVNKYGFVETWRINKNINALNLIGYMIYKFVKEKGDKVTAVIPLSIEGIPLATMTANWLGINLFILHQEPYLNMSHWEKKEYLDKVSDKISSIYLPLDTLKKGDFVLFVDLSIDSIARVGAALDLVRKFGAVPWGIVSMTTKEALESSTIINSVSPDRILILLKNNNPSRGNIKA